MSSDSTVTSESVTVSAVAADGLVTRALNFLKRTRATTFFSLAALAVYLGWIGREGRTISAGEGLGYWLGIIGGTLMVALLLYSVRKRIPLLRKLGPTRHWFRMHMSLGIIGPIIILYHSNFQVGSINSQVALYCTLLVAASGVVGRYFYAKIHNGLFGSSSSLRQLVRTVETSKQSSGRTPGLNAQVREQLASLAEDVLKRPETLGTSALAPVWLGLKTRVLYWQMRGIAYRNIDEFAESSAVARQHRSRLRRATRQYLRRRLGEIRKVAQFGFFEKLFSLWHVIHVPFFLMMVLSAVVHVLAVHMY
jgi:hypothetical protein